MAMSLTTGSKLSERLRNGDSEGIRLSGTLQAELTKENENDSGRANHKDDDGHQAGY
jgi:hypothetical protein